MAASKNPDSRCLELFAQLPAPERDAELISAIEKLAGTNPLRAVELARAEKNLRLRDQLLNAAFRGWGKMDAHAAANWILSQTPDAFDRNAAIASVFSGAVNDPDAAVQLAQRLVQQYPDNARDCGDALIYALAQKGNFESAADFAADGDNPQLRTEWLAAAYGSWANYQPQTAAASASGIADETARADALNAVISTWGPIDPEGLADFAENNLPAGDQKTRALSQALIFWASSNPLAAANWINHLGPSSDFDSGEAAIATQQQVMQQPSVAINWAESIRDPDLRSHTVAAVVETWLLSDSADAINFVRTSTDLSPSDREELLARFSSN
ncbi:MAG TPA: hypothetical protein VFV23_15100 [Verrucomicrobiae bacterium]|nr:hypothetical protein [Verrucomicrobiae bacterium]